MAMFIGYFEISVNFNVKNRREKFIILILYPIYRILIRSPNLLCFLRELLMSFSNSFKNHLKSKPRQKTNIFSLFSSSTVFWSN